MTAHVIEPFETVPPLPGKLWEVKVGTAAGHFLSTARKAAERIAAIAERRLAQGRPIMFTVYRLDTNDEMDWDASTDVVRVFTDTGWPASNCVIQRAQVIDILEAILSNQPG